MSVLAVIPARMASRRFPGKPLADLRGKPLVEHVWAAVSRCPDVTRLVIATDSEDVERAGKGFGAEVVKTAGEHATGSDRVAEAAARLGRSFAVVVNVQGDEPLIAPEAVSQAIRTLTSASAEVSTLAHPDSDRGAFASKNVVKVACDLEGNALYFSRAPMGDTSRPPSAWHFLRHLGIYAFRSRALADFASWPQSPLELVEGLEQLRLLEYGLKIRVGLTSFTSRGVDTPEDLAALEREWDSLAAPAAGADPVSREASP